MKRFGVTLLEVLFAIAIAAIGILGVLSLIVVAGHRASEGATADAADRLGRSAVRDFSVRGLNVATGRQGTWAAIPVGGQAYCIDPLYVAANGTASPHCWFPAFDPAVVPGVRLHRISLRPFPGDQAVAPLPPIAHALGESIFMGKDDLLFTLPDDRTLPPAQNYGTGATRQFTGAFTWLATVQAADYRAGPASLQIVVLRRRDLADPDRLLKATSFAGPPGSLCQIRIAVRSGQPDSDLELKVSTWVLLTGIDRQGTARFGWYRVTDVGSVLASDAACPTASRWIELWNRDWACDASATQVAIAGPVVAVYEKSVIMTSN